VTFERGKLGLPFVKEFGERFGKGVCVGMCLGIEGIGKGTGKVGIRAGKGGKN
jgi:hypothetical protein